MHVCVCAVKAFVESGEWRLPKHILIRVKVINGYPAELWILSFSLATWDKSSLIKLHMLALTFCALAKTAICDLSSQCV